MNDIDEISARACDVLKNLTALLAEEARLIAAGRTREALALATAKAEAADVAAMVLPELRARFASIEPEAARTALRDQIGAMQETMQEAMTLNLAVLATARTVAEGLLREVSRRIAPQQGNAYGPRADTRAPSAPILLSRNT